MLYINQPLFLKKMMKLTIVIASLKMSKGKVCAQVGHAVIASINNLSLSHKLLWQTQGEKIVVCKGDPILMVEIAKKRGVRAGFIYDAGKTQIEPGTLTCCWIGPTTDSFTNELVLY